MSPGTRDHAFGQDIRSLSREPHVRATAQTTADQLWRRWSEAHRAYHNLAHLDEVLAAIAALAPDAPAEAGACTRLAACYHDAIYDPARADNEAASAALARSELDALGIPPAHLDAICRLILETADHELPQPGSPSSWLHDADLWILAAPSERFDDYCLAVRAEYAAVPADVYASARSRILIELADRPALYAEPAAREEWEPHARANLARAIERLRTGVDQP